MMSPLSSKDILEVWELGRTCKLVEVGLLILKKACTERAEEEWVHLTLGQRNGYLIQLRQLMFGSHVDCVLKCGSCMQQLEFSFNVDEVCSDNVLTQESLECEASGAIVHYRLPTMQDIMCAVSLANEEAGLFHLLEQSVVMAHQNGESLAIEDFTEDQIDQIASHMAKSDPQAEILFEVQCESCLHNQCYPFDILSFFWEEISASAKRVLQEVDAIARVYNWSEDSILAMSPERRKIYLELIS